MPMSAWIMLIVAVTILGGGLITCLVLAVRAKK